MIRVLIWPEEHTRTRTKSCYWVAECELDGTLCRARSRLAAANELARTLVANGIADAPMQTFLPPAGRWAPCAPMGWGRPDQPVMSYKSFHQAALWTYEETASGPAHRVRWKPPTDFAAAFAGHLAKNEGETPSDDPLSTPVLDAR